MNGCPRCWSDHVDAASAAACACTCHAEGIAVAMVAFGVFAGALLAWSSSLGSP